MHLLRFHTRMEDVTEPKLGFELKSTENGQNVTEPKLDLKPYDPQNVDFGKSQFNERLTQRHQYQ